MTDIASRALAAHAADSEAKRLEAEAKAIRDRQQAVEQMTTYAHDTFGVTIDPETVETVYPGKYVASVELNEDATLQITRNRPDTVGGAADLALIEAKVVPCEQLDWDLPPGVFEKGPGGGTYSCFGLDSRTRKVTSLADVGRQLEKIAKARTSWQTKNLGAIR